MAGPAPREHAGPRPPAPLARAAGSRMFRPCMRLPRAVRTIPAAARLALAPCLALSLHAAPAAAAWHSREEIAVESPVYRLVSDLATSHGITSGLPLTRPWTRAELGRFLDQLVADVPSAAGDPAVRRLRRELEPGGGFAGAEPLFAQEREESSLEISPYVRASFAEDRARRVTVRDHRVGLQGSLALGERALLFADGYVGTVTPGAHGTPDADGSFRSDASELTAWFDRAYAVWQSPGFTVRAGHTWLSWGPGLAGTLALSDGAPAHDLVEAGIRVLGDARLQWFVATLDPAGERFLAGHRLAIRAGPSVELGLSELARFDGAGHVPLYLLPVVPYALFDRRVRGASDLPADSLGRVGRNNIMLAADFSWTWRPGVRLYGELLVDDATLDHSRPFAAGWQAGAHLRRVIAGGAWSLRGDFTRIYRYVYSVDHGHDFAHAGFPTGFPLGPDVEQFAARLEWRPDEAWAFGLEGVAIRKGSDPLGLAWQPGDDVPSRLVLTFPVEQDQRASLTADWSPSPTLTLSGSGGFASIHSLGHVHLLDTDGVIGRASATVRW